jgi:hypothetical protein
LFYTFKKQLVLVKAGSLGKSILLTHLFSISALVYTNRGLSCGARFCPSNRGLTYGADRYLHIRGLTYGADHYLHTRGLTYGADRLPLNTSL